MSDIRNAAIDQAMADLEAKRFAEHAQRKADARLSDPPARRSTFIPRRWWKREPASAAIIRLEEFRNGRRS